MGKAFRKYIGVIMSWRIVVIENQAKLDYKMGYMVVRGFETKRVLDAINDKDSAEIKFYSIV